MLEEEILDAIIRTAGISGSSLMGGNSMAPSEVVNQIRMNSRRIALSIADAVKRVKNEKPHVWSEVKKYIDIGLMMPDFIVVPMIISGIAKAARRMNQEWVMRIISTPGFSDAVECVYEELKPLLADIVR